MNRMLHACLAGRDVRVIMRTAEITSVVLKFAGMLKRARQNTVVRALDARPRKRRSLHAESHARKPYGQSRAK